MFTKIDFFQQTCYVLTDVPVIIVDQFNSATHELSVVEPVHGSLHIREGSKFHNSHIPAQIHNISDSTVSSRIPPTSVCRVLTTAVHS